jgi:hypothetical protein
MIEEVLKQYGTEIRNIYLGLDEEKRREVDSRARDIGYDESACELYGIKYYGSPRAEHLCAAAMDEMGLLPKNHFKEVFKLPQQANT